jgi:hypothetical protein
MSVQLVFTVIDIHRLRVFENRVVRKIFGPKRAGVTAGGRNCMRNFTQFVLSPFIIRVLKEGG